MKISLLDQKIKITKNTLYTFNCSDVGWYLISISARLLSSKQRGKNETDDEDLALTLDGYEYKKPGTFSGATQRGFLKTTYIIARLAVGRHELLLKPDNAAEIEEISINPLVDFPKFSLNIQKKAEMGNVRPWITIILHDLALEQISVSARIKWHFQDGDDIKLIIDGQIQKNPKSILHKNWIFSATPLNIFISNNPVKKTIDIKLVRGIHFIEFWADQSPTIENIIIKTERNLQQYVSDLGSDNNYNRFDKEIIESVDYWNNYFQSEQFPPDEPLDPDLVKAMIYIESRVGYGFSVGYPAFPDVMQVADDRNKVLKWLRGEGGESMWSDVPDAYENHYVKLKYENVLVTTPKESIYWGVRWLYHKKHNNSEETFDPKKRLWYPWDKAVEKYNGGSDPDYKEKVYSVYERGVVNEENKTVWKTFFKLPLVALILYCAVTNQNPVEIYEKLFPEVMIPEQVIVYAASSNISFNERNGLSSVKINTYPHFDPLSGTGAKYLVVIKREWDEVDYLREKGLGREHNHFGHDLIFTNEKNGILREIYVERGSDTENNSFKTDYFSGNNILVGDFDDDPEPEVIEINWQPGYESVVDPQWKYVRQTYFDYDQEKLLYIKTAEYEENRRDFWWIDEPVPVLLRDAQLARKKS